MNKKLFRLALEDEAVAQGAEPTVSLIGPLSEAYTQALAVAYDNTNPLVTDMPQEEPAVATESQAIDVSMMAKLSRMLSAAGNEATPTDNFQTVYGVAKSAVNEKTVVEVTRELAEKSEDDRKDDFIMIVDATAPVADGVEVRADLISALESMVKCHGGKVYSSLEEFAKTL
jgi:threonine synthase